MTINYKSTSNKSWIHNCDICANGHKSHRGEVINDEEKGDMKKTP
jgi:hypothetical protein